VAIPGGLYADSAAVAEHLLRLPGIVVLVDGYNVAKLGWAALSLEAQRERTIVTAEDIARRWGTDVTIVFDGADVPGASAPRRRLVRVVYSPAGVLADDVLRAEVDQLDHRRQVVVVTSDQAVVADVRAAGANTIASDQFLGVARR
jgi:predicted RNA-binding protein with PIN domain